MSGKKFRVPESDPRYTEWSNRKPSKRKKLQAKILSAPGDYVRERAGKVAEESLKRVATTTLRRAVRLGGAAAVGELAVSGVAVAATTTGALAILAAGYVVSNAIAKNQQLKLGERINLLSAEFVNVQKQVMAKFGVREWASVPAEVRNKAVADYKRALATATAQAQGSALVGVRESYK